VKVADLRHQLTTGSPAIPTNDPVVNTKLARQNPEQFYQVFPRLRNLGLQPTWAGRIDATPDLIPIIDQVKYKNFYLGAGFNGHGFALAPIVGRLMSELAIDGRASLDLNSFRLSRFSEGNLDRQKGDVTDLLVLRRHPGVGAACVSRDRTERHRVLGNAAIALAHFHA